jgi:DNA repair exonuclease SbcCD ATPase subunit
MLRQLEVWSFRQHAYKKFDFTEGLNVLRGANESGKSTVIEAITYALFGISACREPLADVVTWGEPETKLKVALTMEIEGTTYKITRKKSGAEVNYDGGKVVGQTEVAQFVGRLFGCSTKNVNRLVLAGQGNIRGALGEGSSKTSALIEELANFGIIDDVLKLIELHLVTGPTKHFEERLVQISAELEPLEAALVAPDTVADEEELAGLKSLIERCTRETTAITDKMGPLSDRRDRLQYLAGEKARLEERVTVLREELTRARQAYQEEHDQVFLLPDTARIDAIRTALANHTEVERRMKGASVVAGIQYPTIFWEGDLENFAAGVKAARDGMSALQAQKSQLERDVAVKGAAKVASSNCSFCGQDFSKLPAVAEKNVAIERELIALRAELDGVRTLITNKADEIEVLEQIAEKHRQIQQACSAYTRDIRWDTKLVPHRPYWAFDAAGGVTDPEALRAELRTLEAQQAACNAHQEKLKLLSEAAARANQQEASASVKLEQGFEALAELPAIEAEVDGLNESYSIVFSDLVRYHQESAEIEARVTAAKAAYEAAKARVDAVRKAKAETAQTIKEMGFNNALKARVQKARPVIANKLWSKVLAAVSRYFTQMRGEESVVTKDLAGFKVNGRPIEGLSGSTLDILGLAIRLALVRTFLPATPLLILDEPSAACDADRTQAMMGFLVGSGFDQMLLVTHEDMSERVAENLIAL